ncbi:hypothetical protein niasHT_028200 [Heterodera trifolii]|uniref:Integrase catalytic domain-containing protein n=1 Tax=Heterodera trifolii TaxID=157864 RepID=A0ABD2K8S8_9BILA
MGKTIESQLEQVYYNLNSPASYAGMQKVLAEARKRIPNLKLHDVQKFLHKQRTYTLFKPKRNKFPRLKTVPSGLHTDWQCDLCIMDSLKQHNDGYRYILVCIDVLSRQIYVAEAESKKSEHMIEAFEKVFKKAQVLPNKMYSDSGLEFQAKRMNEYWLSKNIIKHVMYSPHLHASVVERANRTIKERLYRYFSEKNTHRWVDIIDKIVKNLNNSVNRTTGMRPVDVNFRNATELRNRLYKDMEQQKRIQKFKIGDIVRITKEKGDFSKGYFPNFTDELFKIVRVNPTNPPSYRISDLEGENIKGIFYDQELVKTVAAEQTTHRAEILKSRVRNGVKQHFVRWIGMDDFYIVLPSNVPFPGNTASHFTVRLPHTLELDSNWSVALSSIIYPHSFPSVGVDEDDFVNIKLLNPDYKPDGTGPTTVTLKVKIPSIQFHSVEHMQKSLNSIIQSAYDVKFPKEKRVKRAAAASADKELEPETRQEPDKELTREVPSSKTLDKELIREAPLPATHDIELPRGDEPKPSEKELGRETRPEQLSDKQLGELEGEKLQKEQLPPTPIVDHGEISTIDQERMDLAKRVTEQSWKETVKLAANAADIAEKVKTALNRAEQARKRAPNAPHVKKWFDRLSNMENNLRELMEKISQESKKAAEAKRKLDVHYDSKNLNECRKHADMSKQALKNSKNYIAQLTPMYFSTVPEDQLGVNELANRVVTAVNNFLNAELTVPRPVEDPQLPAGQPKQQQEKQMEKLKPTVEKEVGSIIKPPVPKLSDEKETKREPTKPTVEKEMEREPVKPPEKELERESPKKADKELEPMVKQQSTQEDNLLEKAKKEIDQTAQNAALKAEYIRTLVANSKHNRGVAEGRLNTYSGVPQFNEWLDQIVELDKKIDELAKKVGNEPSKVINAKQQFDKPYRMKNLTEARKLIKAAKNAFEVILNYSLEIKQLNNKMHELNDKFTVAVKEKEEEEAKESAAINIQQEKKLEKEIPQVLKELEREKSQHDINTTAENTETEFPSSEYEIDDSSEKQPERAEEQAEVSYVLKKKEGKLEEEKIETKDDTAINEFPSTEYGIEESETEETEKWSPDQAKQKILKGKEEPFEQPDGQKDEETILVIGTDKKGEEFPSNQYEIEDNYSSSSSSFIAQNEASVTTIDEEGLLTVQIKKLPMTGDNQQKTIQMVPSDFPSYNDDDSRDTTVNELSEEQLASTVPEEDMPKSEPYDVDELPDLPNPQALSAKGRGGDKKGVTFVSDRVKMLMGHQKQQRKAVEFLFNEITQRFYINIGSGVQHVDASSHLAYVLGFENTRLYYNHPAKYLPDLSGGVRQLYVYAPKLVEDTIIGDRMAPLLRVVNVSGTVPLDVPEQEGRGEQQYFVGTRYQRGGGLLQNVARFLMPVASNLLSSASKEGIAAGTRVLGDLSQGKALKESLETHAKQGFENLAGKLQQCGKGGNYGADGRRGQRVSKTGPYLFRLFSDSQYCDLSKTYMYLLTSIERKNAAGEWVPTDDAIEEDRHVGVIQNFGSSFVRSLKVNISGVEVFDSSIYYHYRAYIMQELGYSHEIRKAFHEAGCYYSDENSQDSYSNKGFTSRAQRFSNGKHCETMVKLNFDLARQNNLLLNNQDVVFTIHRNSDSFLLLTPRWKTVIDEVKDAQGNIVTAARVTWHDSKSEYRIRLHDMRLYLRTVDVTSSLNVAISRQLESTPAKYALRKVEMRSIFLGTGRTELSHNVFTSTLPRRLICAFVSTGAYSGARHLSPFNFEHANVRSISAEANGLTFPSTPYLFSFGNQKRFVRAFVDMYAGLGLDDSDNKTVSISMARFLSGWAFFVIPMTSTLDDTPGFELIRQGTCTVKVQFEQPIKADGYEMLILVARCSGVPYCEVLATLHSTRTVANLLVKGSYPIHFESHRQIEPTACFEYNGKSYVFFEDRVADEMHIYCGQRQKIVKRFLANAKRTMFDYMTELRQIRSTSSSSNISSENIGIFDPLELKTLADVSNGVVYTPTTYKERNQLYALFKSEIDTQLSNYFPNPLQSVNCVHVVNTEYKNQPVIVEGTLDLVDHLLFSTCYPKKRQGIEWSEPLYVELSDLMVCPGDLPKCLSHFGPQRERPKLMVDELDWHDSDDTADEAW